MEQVTAAQMKQIEQAANAGGLSYLTMMENAGRAAAERARQRWPRAQTAAVFCGKGNNGGDGFVVARLLHQAGLEVRVILTDGPVPATRDAQTNFDRAKALSIPMGPMDEASEAFVQRSDVLIDGVCGTGFHGDLRPGAALAARWMNTSPGAVLALDIPSGVECDTGRVAPGAVQADCTVAFHAAKPCHTLAAVQCGEVVVADIGIRL